MFHFANWMAGRKAIVTVLCELCLIQGIICVLENSELPHTAVLDSEGNYRLSWGFNDTHIMFEVHVRTHGYVGFGVSTNGEMEGADIMIGGLDSLGFVYFSDRHGVGNTEPVTDNIEDWYLVSGTENTTHTILRFGRPLDICDPEDLAIKVDTIRVIWAYGREDFDSEGRLSYHEDRGTKSVFLLAVQSNPPVLPEDSYTLDFLNQQVQIPSNDTTYWCQAFPVPVKTKHHVIKFEAVVQNGHEGLIHHVIIYGCFNATRDSSIGRGHLCYHRNMPEEWWGCNAVMFAWGIGGGEFYYPDHVGYPLGLGGDPDILLMETHYDNPKHLTGLVDSSGIRLTVTRTLRQYDAGTLSTGVLIRRAQVVPPLAPNFVSQGHCHRDCLQQALHNQDEGIHIFAGVLHSHLLGVVMRVRHFRDGKELPNIMRDENYDFNLQETRVLREEVTILPGDHIIVECHYDSSNKETMTLGGVKTTDEMCLAFVQYYPRIALTNCESSTLPSTLNTFLQEYISGGSTRLESESTPSNDIWNDIDWTDISTQNRLQELTLNSKFPVALRCQQGPVQYQVHGEVESIPELSELPVVNNTCQYHGRA